MTSGRLLAQVALAFALASPLTMGCRKKDLAAAEATPDPPPVSDASADLMFTWIDESGEFHVEQRVADVPAGARESVLVRDPARDPLSGDRAFVVDLRAPRPDGTYAVRIAANREFEDLAVARRSKDGGVLAPRAAGDRSSPAMPSAEKDVATRPAVIVYGASWCGPCHQAAAYLKKRGIPFVEHDIEKDSAAGREMHAKLAKAGMHGGSIPVLDVRGKILVGFDANAVERALAAKP